MASPWSGFSPVQGGGSRQRGGGGGSSRWAKSTSFAADTPASFTTFSSDLMYAGLGLPPDEEEMLGGPPTRQAATSTMKGFNVSSVQPAAASRRSFGAMSVPGTSGRDPIKSVRSTASVRKSTASSRARGNTSTRSGGSKATSRSRNTSREMPTLKHPQCNKPCAVCNRRTHLHETCNKTQLINRVLLLEKQLEKADKKTTHVETTSAAQANNSAQLEHELSLCLQRQRLLQSVVSEVVSLLVGFKLQGDATRVGLAGRDQDSFVDHQTQRITKTYIGELCNAVTRPSDMETVAAAASKAVKGIKGCVRDMQRDRERMVASCNEMGVSITSRNNADAALVEALKFERTAREEALKRVDTLVTENDVLGKRLAALEKQLSESQHVKASSLELTASIVEEFVNDLHEDVRKTFGYVPLFMSTKAARLTPLLAKEGGADQVLRDCLRDPHAASMRHAASFSRPTISV